MELVVGMDALDAYLEELNRLHRARLGLLNTETDLSKTSATDDPKTEKCDEGDVSKVTRERSDEKCYVGLTEDHLNAQSVIDRVRSPQAGAIVLFAGTTRDTFGDKPVKQLQYSAYRPKALQTLLGIAQRVRAEHGLQGVAMVHRLGTVPIGEESILIAVSAPHRQAAWRAGEQALEECKASAEIWKLEEFHGEEGGQWRANRDAAKPELDDGDCQGDASGAAPAQKGKGTEPKGDAADGA